MIWWLLAGILALIALPFVLETLRQPVDEAARETAPGRFAELPEGITHYRWTGPRDGPVAVCVHGLTTPQFVWDRIADDLAHMGFRVLTYDLYGRGYSDRPGGDQDAAFFFRQLNALLDDQGIAEPVTVLGYSMGGAIATAFAAQHPERVERVVLLAPAGLGHDLGGLMKFAANTPLIGDWLMQVIGGVMLRKGIRAEGAMARSAIPDIHDLQEAETRKRGFLSAVLSSTRHMLRRVQTKEHKAIAATDISVLAIWGEEDSVIPLSGLGKLAELHRDARQVAIPGAGHGLAYTHPKEVRAALQELMREGL